MAASSPCTMTERERERERGGERTCSDWPMPCRYAPVSWATRMSKRGIRGEVRLLKHCEEQDVADMAISLQKRDRDLAASALQQ